MRGVALLLQRVHLSYYAETCLGVLQVRQLREELLTARRERAVGEAREAELRRELSSLKRQASPQEAPQAAHMHCD